MRRVLHAPGAPVLELEASHGVVASGGLVSQWTDQSANFNHLLAAGSERPAVGTAKTPTGENAVSFDGVDDRLMRSLSDGIAGLPDGNSDRTMFFVAQFHYADGWGGAAYGAGAPNNAFGLGVVASGANEG
ncbi:MAG: hypothetical protein HKN47_11060, partial [Pirellulaceae bacterium]|nr:hypothetical protein [Pirellulaceae bacterium]